MKSENISVAVRRFHRSKAMIDGLTGLLVLYFSFYFSRTVVSVVWRDKAIYFRVPLAGGLFLLRICSAVHQIAFVLLYIRK